MPKDKKQPIIKSRNGWDNAFRRMHRHGDDVLLDLAAFEKRAKERSRPFVEHDPAFKTRIESAYADYLAHGGISSEAMLKRLR